MKSKFCGNCKKPSVPGITLKRCSGCHTQYYCGDECQTKAWKTGHKKECKKIRADQKWQAENKRHDRGKQLLCYAKDQNVEEVERLLIAGVDPNYTLTAQIGGKSATTALFVACVQGNEKIVSLLLEHKADVDKPFEEQTPLQAASKQGHDQCLSLLLQYGADCDREFLDGKTSLIAASQLNYARCVALLLQGGADCEKVDEGGYTALMTASQCSGEKCMIHILKYQPDCHKTNKQGVNALHIACCSGHHRCVALLLEHDISLIDQPNFEFCGYTPTHYAIQNGHLRCLLVLIKYKADVTKIDVNGDSPAFFAIRLNQIKCFALLLRQESVSIDGSKNKGLTMLQVARQYGRSNITRLLLEKGAADTNTAAFDLSEEDKQRIRVSKKRVRATRMRDKRCEYPDCSQRDVAPDELKKCSLCMEVWYCCEAHQKLHWKWHLPECKQMRM